MKPFLIVLAAILAAGAIYVGVSEMIVTDEERIEALVEQVSQAVENEDIARCMSHVSMDFIYEPKGVDKARLASLAQRIFDKADKLVVNISYIQIDVQGDEATVMLNFRLLGEYVGRMDQFVGRRGFILGKPLKAARATLKLRKMRLPEAHPEAKAVWTLCRVIDFDPGV